MRFVSLKWSLLVGIFCKQGPFRAKRNDISLFAFHFYLATFLYRFSVAEEAGLTA